MKKRTMTANLKFGFAVAILLGASSAVKPALAEPCRYYDCASETLVYPQPAPYAHYHYLGHGPGHDTTPMDFSDGHAGHIPGRWYWGGNAWGYVPSQYYDQYRGGRW